MAGMLIKGPNRAKQKLLAGKSIAVLNPNHPDPSLVEHLGQFGIDAIFIDTELQSTDVQTVENMRRAADVAGLATILRPTTDEPWLLTRLINRGVGGIHVPHVSTAAQAERIITTVDQTLTHNGAVAGRSENFMIVVSLDSPQALANATDILKIDGIDVFFVEPYDLSYTMGGDARKQGPRHPDVIAAVYRALDQIVAAGKIAGTRAELADVPTLRRKGVRYIYDDFDRLIASQVGGFVKDATG
jgi:4-hydroxy-2-oxoheptanedioate aldolase